VVGRPTGVLTCYRARKVLGAYLDGALGEGDARWTERHLAACAACQAEVAQLRRIKALIAETAAVPEPDWTGFFPGIVRGIQDEQRAEAPEPARAWRWWPQWAMGGAAVATAALALVLWHGAGVPLPAEASVRVHAADTDDPGATVMVYTSAEKDLAVVWLLSSD
jgi:anti-sigma factor RsiW